jgi:hypothetical protein
VILAWWPDAAADGRFVAALSLTEPQAPAAADDAPGSGEDPQPDQSGFPAAGRAGQGEQLGPGEELAG